MTTFTLNSRPNPFRTKSLCESRISISRAQTHKIGTAHIPESGFAACKKAPKIVRPLTPFAKS